MRTVWKYQITFMQNTVGTFYVPEGGRLVHVEAENIGTVPLDERTASLWFEVNPEHDAEVRVFEVFGTGHSIPEDAGEHVGTIVVPPLVLHVYERPVADT